MNNGKREIYSYSLDWKLDKNSISKETVKQHNGNSRDIYCFDVHKINNTKPCITNRPEFGNDLYLHEHKVIKLKAASNFLCDIVLRVHYNSYVTKTKERKRCFDIIPFRCSDMFYTNQFKSDLHDSLCVENLSLKEFAQLYNTTPAIVKRIYTDSELKDKMSQTSLNEVTRLVIYEYHFDSEKQDCTIVFDLDTGLLLFAERGQTGKDVKAFFEQYKENLMPHVKEIYVNEDNNFYIDAIEDEYPNIEIKHDFNEALNIFIDNTIKQINLE